MDQHPSRAWLVVSATAESFNMAKWKTVRVLVAGDDLEFLDMMQARLEKEGLPRGVAASGMQAVAKATAERPQLLAEPDSRRRRL